MDFSLTKLIRRIVGSLNYRVSKLESNYWQRRMERARTEDLIFSKSFPLSVGVELLSLCGQKQVPEQILSLLSFLRHVGQPSRWTIVSDGSLMAEEKARLSALSPVVRFTDWRDYITEENRACVEPYSLVAPMGKKLALITSLPTMGRAVYVDTDILFFAGAHELRDLLSGETGHRFLPDNWGGIVEPLLRPEDRRGTPVNGGFLIQAGPLSWQRALGRLQECLERDPSLLTDPYSRHLLEQTVVYLGYNEAGAEPLDENRYVLRLDDAFLWRDAYLNPATVLRHYVIQSRIKFWRHARSYLK